MYLNGVSNKHRFCEFVPLKLLSQTQVSVEFHGIRRRSTRSQKKNQFKKKITTMKSLRNASTAALLTIILLLSQATETKAFVVLLPNTAHRIVQSAENRTPLIAGVNPTPRNTVRVSFQLDDDIKEALREIRSSPIDPIVKICGKVANTLSAGFKRLKDFVVGAIQRLDEEPILDREDEMLFRVLSQNQHSRDDTKETQVEKEEESKIVVHPEVMDGIRVVGVPGPVIDAEILGKTPTPQ